MDLQAKTLRRQTSDTEFDVYRAALEWDLTDPIVIENRGDLKSELRWRERLQPFNHQIGNLVTFCRRLPVTLLADDVGLGKTISAGLIISELISRSRLSSILIVCPKLLGPQWQEELRTKFDLPSKVAVGQDLITATPGDVGAIITTYASARMHLDKLPRDRFGMLVLDEAHKLRNLYGVESPPQVARRFRTALEDRRFRYVLMLTATPIHNRLWDIYSLVDLLTVARGHQNPFGSEGAFVRKFIADGRDEARRLKPEAKDDFRSIVYGYMSRIRRGDAKLYFPDRIVQMHRVEPTAPELKLIQVIAEPIQKLNRLAQISILQALTSSPDALMAQLNNMARKGTVPQELAAEVTALVKSMPSTAKLRGLQALVERLKKENPQRWRMVVFTGRIETQTTIQAFLEGQGLQVGIINGSSGPRNQETITGFRATPPKYHVIVSTEAGSEGVNLQVANVLVNYDLPWNPMLVEQRIGRVQRLASEHKNVSIFNIMLRGTFEEYIVGRLLEKLQMASHAIGDIEALLEASGLDDSDSDSFDERIRHLVVSALAGRDVEEATRREEASIEEAKQTLSREQENINSLLGRMDESIAYVGPRAPRLPPTERSMGLQDFTLSAFKVLGDDVTDVSPGVYAVQDGSGRQLIRFDEREDSTQVSSLITPSAPLFARLVDRIVATGIHHVVDADIDPGLAAKEIATNWVASFGGATQTIQVDGVRRSFEGEALIRVRANVAHDSYERLVSIPCHSDVHTASMDRSGMGPIQPVLTEPQSLGVDRGALVAAAEGDEAISEFSRFYLERREQEVKAAQGDDRKAKKLFDEFTPRLEMTLVALRGRVFRTLDVTARFKLEGAFDYQSAIAVRPSATSVVSKPEMGRCEKTNQVVPISCLARCDISGSEVLKHLLQRSEISSRLALPEHIVQCALSHKRILKDEAEASIVTGRLVARNLLKVSAVSKLLAEPEHCASCEFTGVDVLKSELTISDISGKKYRLDQQVRSAVSGRGGHLREFLTCHETRQPIAVDEAERCEVTGHTVRPGILEGCQVTQKRVLPSELLTCAASGKRALKDLFVMSSISKQVLLKQLAIGSQAGQFCAPNEAVTCAWGGAAMHPADTGVCSLTGLRISASDLTANSPPRLRPLVELLDGRNRSADLPSFWEPLATELAPILKHGGCKIQSALLAPTRARLAVCLEVKTLLGLRTHFVGLVYSIKERGIVGRAVKGRRSAMVWTEAR